MAKTRDQTVLGRMDRYSNTWATMDEMFHWTRRRRRRRTKCADVIKDNGNGITVETERVQRCRGNPSVTVVENSFCRAFKIFIGPLIFAVIGTDRIYRIISPSSQLLAREGRLGFHGNKVSFLIRCDLFSLFFFSQPLVHRLSLRTMFYSCTSKVESAFKYTANRLSLKP